MSKGSCEYHEAREQEFSGVTCFIHGRLKVKETNLDVNVPHHILKLTCGYCHPDTEAPDEQR